MYEYLNNEVFFCRQTFAAYLLRDVDHVIELGGLTTSIRPFLKPEQTYITIDPEIANPDGITKIKATFQEHRFDVRGLNYGVVILGMQLLNMEEKHWNKLFRLINGSNTTVIEAPNWPQSKYQFQLIRDNVNKEVVWRVMMNLSGNNLDTDFVKREMFCLR